ncbi:MAG: hypothetical protein R2744_04555 [Bacteroidales bacterium]
MDIRHERDHCKQVVSRQSVSGFSLEPIEWNGLDNHVTGLVQEYMYIL